MTRSGRRLRIAQVAPPAERVPPYAYGGTERVVDALVHELVGRGHEVTTFASADSDVPGRLVATVPKALRSAGFDGDQSPYFVSAALEVVRRQSEFDVVHSHLEWMSLLLARALTVPTVSTFHGRV
ncbi:MAG TPA: glycosyltransferase, partial [Candidatus Dormibacteraeota bacterium]|nr:glycosyltransferase [Candidatus Dormibacteraeota bacterium]